MATMRMTLASSFGTLNCPEYSSEVTVEQPYLTRFDVHVLHVGIYRPKQQLRLAY